MNLTFKKFFLVVCAVAFLAIAGSYAPARAADAASATQDPVPSAAQLDWHENPLALYIHFGLNTFTGKENATGEEDPALFNPAALDCAQWVRVAREAGIKRIIITAKNSDGFCLWPTKTTDRSVKSSSWKGGKGDVIRDLAKACRANDIKLGIACSAGDLAHPDFKNNLEAYYPVYREQLTELLTNYGQIYEIWFDGRGADEPKFTDWPNLVNLVREKQPEAIVKQGPSRKDMRQVHEDAIFVGNHKGQAPETNWGFYPRPNTPRSSFTANLKPFWFPIECRIPLAKGFWNNEEIKPLADLLGMYYTSVGRGSVLLICAAPDKNGLLTDEAAARLKEFGAAVKTVFATDLAARMPVKASSVRAGDQDHGPDKAVDRNSKTWWAAKDGATDGWLEVSFPEKREFNVIRIEEMVTLGQHVQEHVVEIFNEETRTWKPVAQGTTIGYRRLHHFPMVKASGVRLRISKALAAPMIKSFGVFVDKVSAPPEAETAKDEQ